MHKSTGKMLKKFDVPVISCYIEGASVCLPHWRKGFRFGNVRVTYKNLFSTEDLKSFSIDEINATVDARLSGAEGALPITKPFQTLSFRRLAEGLHQLLYFCPRCSMEFTTITEGNSIRCTACGNEAIIDRESRLTPGANSITESDISLWYKAQVQNEMSSLREDMEPITECVKVRTPSAKAGGGMIENGFGTIRLDPTGWHFDGEISNVRVSRFFSVESVPAMSYDHCDNFQIYSGGDYFMFVPEDPKKCIKYVILAEGMHRKFASQVLLTPGVNSGFD
jgi:hypothetical protein